MNHIQKKSKNKSIAHTLGKFRQAAYFLQFHSRPHYIRRLLSHVLERLDHPKQHDQD